MNLWEWFRCLLRGGHSFRYITFLRTTEDGEKYRIKKCLKCGASMKTRVW